MSQVKIVTCCGMDDATDLTELFALCAEGANGSVVEVGLQLCAERGGNTKGYPTLDWVRAFAQRAVARFEDTAQKTAAAIHLNREWVLALIGRKGFEAAHTIFTPHYEDGTPVFRRVQLNFEKEPGADAITAADLAGAISGHPGHRFILRSNDLMQARLADMAAEGVDFDVLFDGSFGTGSSPDSWPQPVEGRFCGYAGGLGPDTVEHCVLEVTRMTDQPFGVDAFSRLKGDDGTFSVENARTYARRAIDFTPV